LPLLAGALLAAEIHMGYPGVRAWLPYLVMVPLAVLLLLALGRTKIQVTSGDSEDEPELWVGDAHLPLRFVGEVDIIDRQHKRKALGPELDPAAFVVHRGWVHSVVRVQLTDAEDPTPYWMISTRRPQRLADVLRQGRAS
jgi:hypothetical protein